MKDLERLLSDSLKSVGDAYGPADPIAARQRFLKRRRRRLFRVSFGGAVAAATAVAVILYVAPAPGPAVRRPALDVTSRFLAVTQSIPVGDAPSGIDIGEAGVWVANSGDGTVMRINQAFNKVAETVDVGGEPDDIAVGEDAVWVTHPDPGTITKIEFPDGIDGEISQSTIDLRIIEQHLDIAYGDGAVWVVTGFEGTLYRIDAETDEVERWGGAKLGSDVAVDADGVPWTLGRLTGRRIINRSDANSDSSFVITGASGGLGTARTNVDLAVGDEHHWISLNTGRVLMLDRGGPVLAEHEVGGSYTGISIYRGLVWAVTGGLDDDVLGSGLLTRFDDATGEQVGEALPLTGRPFDVAVGETGIWLTHNSTDSVSHISDTEAPAPAPTAPTPEPEETEAAVDESLVFVYSAGGDVYGESKEGDRVVLADGPEDEVWPSLSPNGTELLYQVGSGPPGKIVHVDLATGTTTPVGAGQFPSFGPDGRAAWVEHNPGEPRIIVGGISSEPQAEIVPIADWEGPILVQPPIAWDPGGDHIYYSAGWEETFELYQVNWRDDADPFPMTQEMGMESGTQLLGPHVRDESSIDVVRACCREGIEDPWESFELGRVSFTEGGGVYETVLELDPRQFSQEFVDWRPQVLSAGNLWPDEDTGEWSPSEHRTWIVVNQIDAWVLSEGGDSYYLSDALIHEHDYATTSDDGLPGTFEGWGAGSAIGSG